MLETMQKMIRMIQMIPIRLILVLCVVFFECLFLFSSICFALEADELLVIANHNARGSIGIARTYMKKRGVPRKNLLQIAVTESETCTREQYDEKIVQPIRKKLLNLSLANRPRCLVLVKGVPLRVKPVPLSAIEQKEIGALKDERKQLEDQLHSLSEEIEKKKINNSISEIKQKVKAFHWEHNTGASVDSELMMVLADGYPLSMWVPNPYFLGFRTDNTDISKNDVIMVSRLDAPTIKIVHRMIDDALKAEKAGLAGTAYFDSRYKSPGEKKVSGYGLYDKSIHLAANRLRKAEVMPVVLDDTQKLFQPGDCPRAALYCGWYSLARYVDAFEWVPGAIGYHIASSECRTLREGKSQVWCKRLLEDGVAVTIGPVGEPYVQAFPLPEVFFSTLIEGTFTVAECYLLSVPYLSWKMVLVGDPLYRPFANRLNDKPL